MRLSDLQDKVVKSAAGEKLGRVHDVHCDQGKVVALMCGPASEIERWTGISEGRRVPWDKVRKVDEHEIVVDLAK